MPLQRRAAQGFAGAAVEIDLIHKGIKTRKLRSAFCSTFSGVEIDLIHKGIKTALILLLILLLLWK